MEREEKRPCGLCGESTILRNSHVIPAFAHALLLGRTANNQHPVHISNGVAVQVPKQVKKYLLGDCCEARFGEVERRVRELVYVRGSPSPLLSRGRRETTIGIDRAVTSLEIEEDDATDLAYFAMSVFWRWHVAKKETIFRLDHWGDHLRDVLLCRAPLSDQVVLIAAVVDPADPQAPIMAGSISSPVSARMDDCWRHDFTLCGVAFFMFIGQSTAVRKFQPVCLVHGDQRRVLVLPALGMGPFRGLAAKASAARAVGKLQASRDRWLRENGR